jgi:hypothetical protein
MHTVNGNVLLRPDIHRYRHLLVLLFLLVLFAAAQNSAAQDNADDIDSFFESGDETAETDADDIDSLFDEPDESDDRSDDTATATDQDAPDDRIDIGALTTSPTKISANVSANLGFGVGLIEWPGGSAADGEDVDDLMRYSGLYGSSARVTVDTRPTSYLRFNTSVGTSLDTSTMNFKNPSVSSFFVDYTFGDTLFVRGGKHGMTWGQGRILGNPANLVSRVSEGIAVRATAPLWRGTTTGLVYGREEWVAQRSETSPAAYGYAGQFEQTLGAVALGLHGHFHMDEDVAGAVTLSWGKEQVNLAGDVAVHWDRKQPLNSDSARVEALGQVLWESPERRWTLGMEYIFDSDVRSDDGDYTGHRTGVALRTPGLFGSGWRPGITWQHAGQDDSGQVVFGIGGTIAPSLNMSIGVPVIYGAPGTYYRDALTEDAETDPDDRDEDAIPLDNVVTVLLGFSLSFSF